MKYKLLILLLLFLVSLPVLLPFFHSGFPETQDGIWSIIRLVEMRRELKDLQIPPQWSTYLNHGFGYPLFLFTYPFPYYLGSIFFIFNFNSVVIIKLLFVLSVILSAWSMYWLASILWGKWGGFLSAVLYIYAPYKLINLYNRGSLGESLASIIYPIILLYFWKLRHNLHTKYVLMISIFLGILVLTHNASAVIFMLFLALWIICLLLNEKKQQLHFLAISLGSIILGFTLSAYFWLPAMLEKNNIMLSIVPLAAKIDHFVPISVLLGLGVQSTSKLPLHLGVIHLGLIILSLCLLVFKPWQKVRNLMLMIYIMILTAFFLTQNISLFFWNLPLFRDIDFPWRVLSMLVLFISLGAGSIINFKYSKYLLIPVVLAIIYFSFAYIHPNYLYRSSQFYETNDATTTSNDELNPKWVTNKPKNRTAEKLDIPVDVRNYTQVIDKSNQMQFNINLNSDMQIAVNALYFPGWKAFVNNNEIPIGIENGSGRILLNLKAGEQHLWLKFFATPVCIIGNILSIASIIIIFYLWIKSRKILV